MVFGYFYGKTCVKKTIFPQREGGGVTSPETGLWIRVQITPIRIRPSKNSPNPTLEEKAPGPNTTLQKQPGSDLI